MKASMRTTLFDVIVYHCYGYCSTQQEHYCTDTNGYLALKSFFDKCCGEPIFHNKIPIYCNLDLDEGGLHGSGPENAEGCRASEVLP